MRQFFIYNQDINVRVCEWGNKNNPLIFCIHGLGSTCLSFLELGEMLKDKYHVLSIDLPGHGKTPPFSRDEDYEIPNLIKWLSKVIDLTCEKEIYLLAHSWGGEIALHYTANYPTKVKKIILLDGGYYIKKLSNDYFSKNNHLQHKLPCSLQEETDCYEKDFDEYIFSSWEEYLEVEKNNYLRWSPLLKEASMDLMKEVDGRVIWHASGDTARGAIKSMYKSPSTLIYNRLPQNILLLQCTLPDDFTEIRDIQSKVFSEGTRAVVKKIEGTTHMIHWDNPNAVYEEILKWFR